MPSSSARSSSSCRFASRTSFSAAGDLDPGLVRSMICPVSGTTICLVCVVELPPPPAPTRDHPSAAPVVLAPRLMAAGAFPHEPRQIVTCSARLARRTATRSRRSCPTHLGPLHLVDVPARQTVLRLAVADTNHLAFEWSHHAGGSGQRLAFAVVAQTANTIAAMYTTNMR